MIKDITQTNNFKRHTKKAIFAIILFAVVYLILLLLALALTIGCVYAGVLLIISIPKFITIVLGLGLASFGVLILIFLIKFLFKSNKVDRSHLVEINKTDEPEIFKLIENIVQEVGTGFPKKVYLSVDVNASVFYDSNFWSMFFPIQKNLVIGVGLINTITQEELKAVLAHEFGHFSQKTMKVGSYVYNVNQVIFNMLYDNDGYDKMIQGWANISGMVAIFAILAVRIVMGIQWILSKMYEVVNKSYMALSREMEFHADEIAANVTGYPPLKNALLRMHLADYSFNNVVSFYDEKIKENKLSQNIYDEQSYVLNCLADQSNLQRQYNFPVVTVEELNKYNKSKLVIKDQWASHPTTEDRIERLEQTGIQLKNGNTKPANTILTNFKETQKKLTKHFFRDAPFTSKEDCVVISFDKFQLEYTENLAKNTYNPIYNGYYDHRKVEPFSLSEVIIPTHVDEISNYFSNEILDQVYELNGLKNDIESLKMVSDKKYGIKTFDFDGKKYKRKQAKTLSKELQKKYDYLNEKCISNDIKIYGHFKFLENKKKETQLDRLYNRFFEYEKDFDSKLQLFTDMHEKLQFIAFNLPIEEIRSNFSHIAMLEVRLKNEIKVFLENPMYTKDITTSMRDNLELYLTKDWQYIGQQSYFDKNLTMLFDVLNNYQFLIGRGLVIRQKELLDYQVSLL